MQPHYDLLIVGGGVLGAFHAYHALQKGLRVAILEKDQLPQGSSVQNFGQIVPSGMDAKWQLYGRKSLEIYKSIQANVDISLRQNGSVYIASDEEEMTLLEELATINKANDYPSQLLTANDCLQRYEGLRADYCRGGLFFPEEITLEPRVALHRILAFLTEQKGLHYFPQTLAIGIDSSATGCRVVASDKRVFQADQVLVCNGYEFQTLFPEIYREGDLQAVKLQMILLEQQPAQRIPGSILTGLSIRRYESFQECPSYQSIKAKEDPDSLSKKWSVHILFKQTADGAIILGDSHEYADIFDKESLRIEIKTAINEYMMEEATKIFNLQTWNIRETWVGMYTQCKNSDVFQRKIDDRIHLLTGIGGKGMTGSAGFSYENINHILGK
ncbi:MAG: TIGR03364 family FAD-dependent oxidoreductase [Saprospiraceae bacterium]|nr:TIGR03364 family FAD-dependent oxidoreductase [Saprospiraceae bacterium]